MSAFVTVAVEWDGTSIIVSSSHDAGSSVEDSRTKERSAAVNYVSALESMAGPTTDVFIVDTPLVPSKEQQAMDELVRLTDEMGLYDRTED